MQSAFHHVNIIYEGGGMYREMREEEKQSEYYRSQNQNVLEPNKHYQDEMLDAKRLSKNRDAAQQSFLIGWLGYLGYHVRVNRLYKKGKTTSQLFTVNSVSKDGKIIYKSSDVKISVDDLRDRRRCIDAVTNSWMIDTIKAKTNACLIEKKCRESKFGEIGVMRRLKKVEFLGSTLIPSDITEIGLNVHSFITKSMGPSDCLITSSQQILNIFPFKI
ncbi:hypothetical protein EIN_327530 [Entamoeba invadens IP1]|uniref:Uncharacterized protein n=1 Tax=Entamoeba invadens IP1 TaxID=370355 RepID=A0A0A1U3B5_ENTIV|nr:hypothetical protein EIN_327530 [Entamoeba invadens IP1]ELP86106.1 hypothetical protein EIN_327530 [Entamoeba invadens IP1]|eukprot:XP_004185452.1 hypothetical protein EIN_327530 [Entamoeba invadens IP1]